MEQEAMSQSQASVADSLRTLIRSEAVSIDCGAELNQAIFDAKKSHRKFDENALAVLSSSEQLLTKSEHDAVVTFLNKAFEFSLVWGALAVKGGRVFLIAQRNCAGVLEISWADCARHLSQRSRRQHLEDTFQHKSVSEIERASGRRLLVTHFGVLIRETIVA